MVNRGDFMDIFKKWWFYVIVGVIILLLPFAIKTALENPVDTSTAPPTQDSSASDTTLPDTAPPDTKAPDTAKTGTAAPDTAKEDTAAPDTPLPDTTAPDASTPDTAVPDSGGQTEPVSVTYVLNTNTKKFHFPSCSSVKDIKEKNRQDSTLTRQEIIDLGYSPCGRCKP